MDSIKCHLITLWKHGGIKETNRLDMGSESVIYLITACDEKKFLLKIYNLNNERNVRLNTEINRCIVENGINTPMILETGKTDSDLFPYELIEWVSGTSLDKLLLGNLSCEQKYKRGVATGRLLKRIHKLDYHTVCEPKHMPLSERIKCVIDRYNALKYSGQYTYRGNVFRDYILNQRTLYPEKENDFCLLHGDFHVGNIIERENKDLWVIDWIYNLIGDPIEDFVRIFVSADNSPEFARGQIDGYFGGKPPQEFWERLKIYVAIHQLEILSFPLGKLSDGRDIRDHQHEIIYEQYEGMKSIIPQFYTI